MGLGRQTRTPRASQRLRRNADDLSESVTFVGQNEVIQLNSAGEFILRLLSAGGLVNTSGELSIRIDGDSLTLSVNGIKVSAQFASNLQAMSQQDILPISLSSDQATEQALIAQALGVFSA